MNCLEFKRLALSDPATDEVSFIAHSEQCPDCLKYVADVRKMDSDLAMSLAVEMPDSLMARLQLAHEMEHADEQPEYGHIAKSTTVKSNRFAIAASFILAVIAGGFFFTQQWQPSSSELHSDYQQLLASVVEHLDEQPMTPVWQATKANETVQTLLASYDGSVRFKNLENLQFGRICPMGNYRGLHATLETENGQTTFAYIKGEPIGELLDTAYQGYITRVKPVRGGNLVIISRSQRAVDQADADLTQAMVWDI